MSPATKDPTEVFYPQWLDTRIAHMADALKAAKWMAQREDTFATVAQEQTDGEREPTQGAREVWGAERVLEDVQERLSGIRADPAEYANEVDGLVGELWEASYRVCAAAVTLREQSGSGGNAYHVVTVLEALADGLNALGAIYDEQQAASKGASS